MSLRRSGGRRVFARSRLPCVPMFERQALALVAAIGAPACVSGNGSCPAGALCECRDGTDCYQGCADGNGCDLLCHNMVHCGGVCGNGCNLTCHDVNDCSSSCGD